MPSSIFPRAYGFIYAVIVIFILAYLWHSKKITRKNTIPVLIFSTLLGFLIYSPLAPHNFQSLLLKSTERIGAPLLAAAVGMGILLVLTFLFGRIFCGHICPVGTVQELVSLLPVKQYGRKLKKETLAIRSVVFVITVAAALLYSFGVVDLFGINDFFHLTITTASGIFVAVLLISVFFYRPFCRFICPFGLILAIVAAFSVYKIRRTDYCTDCGRCEKVCPVDEVKFGDKRAECFMCGRCIEKCGYSGAIRYGREDKK
ncbi:4Fe-4S binding protein [Methanoplanus sp. FWC-SCC4]|uniref:4Fe-4S binding protein n=1 Tax=Methanochimaera problematica TaxID=2609417 RepID=A0AA97FDD1_9EURY|nr:4Fe-4S binding protein [Methanoplanus sp. FWC-SCC4]WOF16884.1 4Fe-4S binding protein [Methanoplanus sp. FWC-SCC4]